MSPLASFAGLLRFGLGLMSSALGVALGAPAQGPPPSAGGHAAAGPFAEAVEVLAAIDGEAAEEQYGWVARAVGDVDGDGVTDWGGTAPFHGGGRGRVEVRSGRTAARLAQHVGAPGSLAGWTVAAAGDLDRDGHADVAVGAPGAVAQGTTQGVPGRVTVLSGRDGSVLRELAGDSTPDRFGEDVTALPDVDGDGCNDLAIGAPQHGAGGAVFVCSGATGARLRVIEGAAGAQFGNSVASRVDAAVLAITALKGGEGSRGEVHVLGLPSFEVRHVVRRVEGSAALGWFLSLVPDRDGDGVHEVYATDWNHGKVHGRAVVVSGASGAVLCDVRGEAPGLGFGIGVAGRDDFDGDGVTDLVVGAWLDGTHGKQCGRVDVRSGRTGDLLGRLTGNVPGAVLGFDADTLGDVDGDGVADLLVTAAYHGARGAKTGRVYVVSGKSVLTKP